MKKQLTVALGLAVLATPAFATKARLQALGEDVNGSFYVNDNRNIFYNPAHVNNHKDLVTFELGNTNSGSAVSDLDATATPKAEGGFFRQAGSLVWGLQFGSESNSSNAFRTAGGVAVEEENNLDLFVGGDSGLKWGANLTYSKSAKDEATADANEGQEAIRSRFGVVMGDTEIFAGLNLTNKAEEAAGDEFKGKLGYRLGATHAWEGYTLFADWQSLTAEATSAAGVDSDLKSSKFQIGAGRSSRLNDRATLFTRVQYQMDKAENEASTQDLATGPICSADLSIFCEEYKGTSIPVVAGVEVEATSWLTLRGSVSQTVWGKQEDADDSAPFRNTTKVNVGASLKFGELSVDGVIGNNDGTMTGATADSSQGKGSLRTDLLMTRVGMTYRF